MSRTSYVEESYLNDMLVKSPFTLEISRYFLPLGFKIPDLGTYDGSTDPEDHLHLFKFKMMLCHLPDPAQCKLFIITLRGDAGRWFDTLEPHSISTFSQLEKSFRSNFIFQRNIPTNLHYIQGIEQGPSETLKEFVVRFKEKYHHNTNISDGYMITVFIYGLQPGVFLKNLMAEPPFTFEDLMVRANNFHWPVEVSSSEMSSEYQRRTRDKPFRGRALRWARKTYSQSDVGSTSSSDSIDERKCILEFDGAVKGYPESAGAGVVLRDFDTDLVYYLRAGLGTVTKHVAEYKALILGLRYALERGYTHICVEGDSKPVCMQVNGVWRVNSPKMSDLCNVVNDLTERFLSFQIRHVEREDNYEADDQANMAVYFSYGEVEEGVIGDSSNFKPLPKWRLNALSSVQH